MTVTGDRPPRARSSQTLRQTIGELACAQKAAKGAPAYSRFINRRLGRLLAAAAFHLGLTPNAVTAISAVWTFIGIALLALVAPSWAVGMMVSACLVIGYAFDAADGQLARLQGGGSPVGEWLDHMVDSVKVSSLHLALAVGIYRFGLVERGALLLVPLGFSLVAAVHFFGSILNDQLRRQHAVGEHGPVPPASVLRSLLVIPTDYGLLCLVFLLLGAPSLFFLAYSGLFTVTALYLVLASVKWFREMQRLGTAALSGQLPADGSSSTA